MKSNNDIVWVERMVRCFELPQSKILLCMSNLIRVLMSDPYYSQRKSFVEEALRIMCALSYEQQFVASYQKKEHSLQERYEIRAILQKEVMN